MSLIDFAGMRLDKRHQSSPRPRQWAGKTLIEDGVKGLAAGLMQVGRVDNGSPSPD